MIPKTISFVLFSCLFLLLSANGKVNENGAFFYRNGVRFERRKHECTSKKPNPTTKVPQTEKEALISEINGELIHAQEAVNVEKDELNEITKARKEAKKAAKNANAEVKALHTAKGLADVNVQHAKNVTDAARKTVNEKTHFLDTSKVMLKDVENKMHDAKGRGKRALSEELLKEEKNIMQSITNQTKSLERSKCALNAAEKSLEQAKQEAEILSRAEDLAKKNAESASDTVKKLEETGKTQKEELKEAKVQTKAIAKDLKKTKKGPGLCGHIKKI